MRAQRKLEQFRKTVVRRDSTENLNTELWYPDLKFFKCVNDPGLTEEKGKFPHHMCVLLTSSLEYTQFCSGNEKYTP